MTKPGRKPANKEPRHLPLVDLLVDARTELFELARSLEPVSATMRSRGTGKSAVSRRFVAQTAAQLAAWQTAPLEALDLVGLLIDGVHIGEHCLIVALGIAADGQKHALGLWKERATIDGLMLDVDGPPGQRSVDVIRASIEGGRETAGVPTYATEG